MKKVSVLLMVVLAIAVMGVSAIAEASVATPTSTEYGPEVLNWGTVKYGGTFTYMQAESVGFQQNIVAGLIYETLGYWFNGEWYPWLATSYTLSSTEAIVQLRHGVKWSDGVPFTAKDVAFTFQYGKEHPTMWLSAGPYEGGIQSVEASGDYTVIFKFNKENPQYNTFLYLLLWKIPIIPEHIWSKVADPSTFPNTNPVGTGPFLLQSANTTTGVYIFTKNPNYWISGRPYIDRLVVESVLNDSAVILSLRRGEVDWGTVIFSNPEKDWISLDPQTHAYWAWWKIVNFFDFNNQLWPFNIPDFRKAVAHGIDIYAIAEKMYPGASIPKDVANMAGLFQGFDMNWMDPTLEQAADIKSYYNPQEAQEMLASLGFKKNKDGLLCGPDGNPLPTYSILILSGNDTYLKQATLIAEYLSSLGIRTSIDSEAWSSYAAKFGSGEYQLMVHYYPGSMPPEPMDMYNFTYSVLDGNASNPVMSMLLNAYNSTVNPREQRQLTWLAERIFLDDQPVIPLISYGGIPFYEGKFVGFPSNSNAYLPQYLLSMPWAAGGEGERLFLNVHLK